MTSNGSSSVQFSAPPLGLASGAGGTGGATTGGACSAGGVSGDGVSSAGGAAGGGDSAFRTKTVIVSELFAPSGSVTVRSNVSGVSAVSTGAVNPAVAPWASVSVTAGPDV